ncbi:uncharacterized protein METZ01_LOCUS176221, partial [marine metagenome]
VGQEQASCVEELLSRASQLRRSSPRSLVRKSSLNGPFHCRLGTGEPYGGSRRDWSWRIGGILEQLEQAGEPIIERSAPLSEVEATGFHVLSPIPR